MQAVADRIIIEKVEVKTTTASGFEIPQMRQKPQQGVICGVGPDCQTAKVGQKAIFAKGAGTEVYHEDKMYIVMREADIFFVD